MTQNRIVCFRIDEHIDHRIACVLDLLAIAIGRAAAAVVHLDAMIEAMRRDGALQEFNSRYKAGRAAALAKVAASWATALRWRGSRTR
jgi:hypothetical protein